MESSALERWAVSAANWFGTSYAIIGVPVVCATWFAVGLSVDVLTGILSILAITISSLVLVAQNRDSCALHLKLDELLHGVDKADDHIAGIEKEI